MLYELFVIGSLPFWSFFAFAVLLEFIFVGLEKLWYALAVPAIVALLFVFFIKIDITAFFSENWKNVLWGILIYFVGASVWATFKWWRRSVKRGRIYANCLEVWASENMPDQKITSINEIPETKKMNFFSKLREAYTSNEDSQDYGTHVWEGKGICLSRSNSVKETQNKVLKVVLSSPKDNKERITLWMVAWPLSIITTFIFDFLYDAFNWMRKILGDLFIWISRLGFGAYGKDFESIAVEKEI